MAGWRPRAGDRLAERWTPSSPSYSPSPRGRGVRAARRGPARVGRDAADIWLTRGVAKGGVEAANVCGAPRSVRRRTSPLWALRAAISESARQHLRTVKQTAEGAVDSASPYGCRVETESSWSTRMLGEGVDPPRTFVGLRTTPASVGSIRGKARSRGQRRRSLLLDPRDETSTTRAALPRGLHPCHGARSSACAAHSLARLVTRAKGSS